MITIQLKFILNFTPGLYLLIFAQIVHSIETKSQCIEDHSTRTYFTIHCTTDMNQNKLELFVDREVRVIIKCNNIYSYNEFEKLVPRDTNLGSFITVQILNCPLSHTLSLGKIIQQLGIRNYKSVQYVNYNMTTVMTQENLTNFSERLQKLILEIRPAMYIREDLFSDQSLRPLKHLYLYGDCPELHSNLFEYLNNLLTLHIETNLKCLPNKILQHQIHLRRLTLSYNQLDKLNMNAFSEASSSLLHLDVKNSNLQSLDPSNFKVLTNLKAINFNNNSLRSLPESLLEFNKHLENFYLIQRTVALKRLPNALLADLTKLQEVQIECDLEIVPLNLFRNSTNIVKIIMSHNKLEYMNAMFFESQVHLRHLDLSHNNLRNLSDKLFVNLKELLDLKLAHNNLKDVDLGSSIFLPLRKMQLLDLNSNQLNNFITLPFDGSMQTLILKNNSLSSLFSVQNNVSESLQQLDLSYNNISHIKSKNFELIFARNMHLDLRYNRIQTIDLAGYGTRTLWNGRLLQVHLNFNPLQCDCHLMEFIRYLAYESDSLKFKVENLKCQSPHFVKDIPIKHLQMKDLLCSVRHQCPPECNGCWRRPYDGTLIVNCTNRALKSVPNLPAIQEMSLTQVELQLEYNQLLQLPPSNTTGYENVNILNVEGNNLTTVENSHLPPYLVALNIKFNLLKSLNVKELLKSLKLLRNISMSGNPFTCDCDDMSFWRFTHNNSRIFVDYTNVTCINTPPPSYPMNFFRFHESCPHKVHVPVITFAITSSLAFLAFALYYKYQEEIKVWLYAHKLFRWLVAQYELNNDKCYDAFLAYSPQDEFFVAEHLVPALENSSLSFKLCIPSRDWLIGDCIPDQIVQAIDNSRRIIFVLSKSFVTSVWSKLEFKYAHQAGLSDCTTKVIIIMYEDIGNINTLDLSLKAYLKTQSYLKWPDKRFWDNLRFAMPHKKPEVNGHLMTEVQL